jgi:multisubunit Na+/H+ antiporter MnhG subunit
VTGKALPKTSFFHVFLPFDFAKAVNFTPTGSTFSTIAMLLLLLPLPLLSLIRPNLYMPLPLALVLSVLFSIVVVLTGSIGSYVILAAIYAATALAGRIDQHKKMAMFFVMPLAITALTFVLAYLPIPGVNSIQTLEANFPKEIQLPFNASWKVSASVFRDAPFFGTGPSTYLFNFTSYKPAEFNLLNFWNFTFDTAHNEFLNVLGTIGAVGVGALALLCVVVAFMSWKNIFTREHEEGEEASESSHTFLAGLGISGIVAIALLGIHATTTVSFVLTLFIFAALAMSQKSIREKVSEFSIGLKASAHNDRQFDLFPILLFIVFVVGAVPVLYKTYTATMADFYHRLALSQASNLYKL